MRTAGDVGPYGDRVGLRDFRTAGDVGPYGDRMERSAFLQSREIFLETMKLRI